MNTPSFNNLTPRAQQALANAAQFAKDFNHSYIGSEHLFLGILKLRQGVTQLALQECGVAIEAVENRIKSEISQIPTAGSQPTNPKSDAKSVEASVSDAWKKVGEKQYSIASDANADKRAPEVRHYLLTDVGTQWFTKLVRREVEVSYDQRVVGGLTERKETVVAESVLDVPSEVMGQPFLQNIYGREETNWTKVQGSSFGGWSISRLEYERIKRLIELTPTVTEFNKLASY